MLLCSYYLENIISDTPNEEQERAVTNEELTVFIYHP